MKRDLNFSDEELKDVVKRLRASYKAAVTRLETDYLLLEAIIPRLEKKSQIDAATEVYTNLGHVIKLCRGEGVIINEEV